MTGLVGAEPVAEKLDVSSCHLQMVPSAAKQAAEKVLCAYERRGPGLKPALF